MVRDVSCKKCDAKLGWMYVSKISINLFKLLKCLLALVTMLSHRKVVFYMSSKD